MRTAMWFFLAASAALGACKWTEFDDLEDETWVGSTEKPNVKSNDYGVAIQRGAAAGDGGTLVVIGTNQPTYSELVYSATGESKLAATTLELNSQYSIGNLDAQPILLADPTGDDIALIVNGGGSQVVVLTGAGQLNMHNLFVSPSPVDAATYLLAPGQTVTQPLVASGEVVIGTFYANPPTPTPTCKLVDGAAAIKPLALGAVRSGVSDDVLAWGSNGKLYRYAGAVFSGCATPATPIASHDTGFIPGHGSQILTIGPNAVLLQGHHEADDTSILQVYNATSLMPIGGSVSTPKLRTAAILDLGADKYVIAGYPANQVGNTGVAGGQVLLYKVSGMAGIETAIAATLNDAQPENNQSFGRAVAAMPFNGKQVIAVAANNEIFVYYRAALYDETRQGR